jgi:hypothetical protein
VRGFEVVTSDKRRVGRVVDVVDRYLVVESGWIRRSRRPIPREFVHVVDEAATVVVTVPRRVLEDAPTVDRRGRFDPAEAARHFGLAESYLERAAELDEQAGRRHIERDVIAAAEARLSRG